MKVVHLITDLDVGGAETMLLRLLTRMDRQRFENLVISLLPIGPIGEQMRSLGIPVESLNMRPGQATPRGFFQLIRFLRNYRPIVLQTWLYHADLLGLLAGKIAGIPAIAWNVRSSAMDFKKYRNLSRLVYELCALFSGLPQTVVINSRAGKLHHENSGYHPRQWQIIPNGLDLTLFAPNPAARKRIRSELNLSEMDTVIGFVARLDPQKDHSTFLQAAALICPIIPGLKFVCVGTGSPDYLVELKTLARELAIENQLIWTGLRKDMSDLYNAFDFSTLPSSYGEGFPNVIAESMACGIPCVATNVGDTAYVIGDCGILVAPRDANALVDGWKQLLNMDIHERHLMGQRARERIQKNFSIEEVTGLYESLYEHIATLQL